MDVRTRKALERVATTHDLSPEQTESLAAFARVLLGWRTSNVLLASKTWTALREEGEAADIAAERCGLRQEAPVPLVASPLDQAVCVVFRKTEPCPHWLPRREGMAAKRPLAL